MTIKTRKKSSLSANVSTLKAHLGQYLRKVRAGAEVVVLDRQLPVAKLVGLPDSEAGLVVMNASADWDAVALLMQENDRKRKATKLKKSSNAYLDEDRGSR